jgi:hypothetical protein
MSCELDEMQTSGETNEPKLPALEHVSMECIIVCK